MSSLKEIEKEKINEDRESAMMSFETNCQKKLVHLHCSISDQISRLFVTFERKLCLVKIRSKLQAIF